MHSIPTPRASLENHGGNGGNIARTLRNESFRRWAAAVTGVLALTTLVAVVFVLGVIAVLNLGPIPGIAVTMLVAALTIGTGVWWLDRKAQT